MKIRRKIMLSDSDVTDTNQLEEDAIAESDNDDINALFEVEKKGPVTIESDDETETQTAMHQEGYQELPEKILDLVHSYPNEKPIIVVGEDSWHYIEFILSDQELIGDLESWQVINRKPFYNIKSDSFPECFIIILYNYLKFITKSISKYKREPNFYTIRKRIKDLKKRIKDFHRVIKHAKMSISEYNSEYYRTTIFEIIDGIWDVLTIINHYLPMALNDFLYNKKIILHLTTHGFNYKYPEVFSEIMGTLSSFTNSCIVLILSIDENSDELDEFICYDLGYTTFTVDSYLNLYSTPDRIFFV